ncbi:MAG TPA: head GIN domain-containing protein [Pyrinomonadaceae bacterium]|nr:head GIN domain-containing protein [Pyrinomonadaceae bacterium]
MKKTLLLILLVSMVTACHHGLNQVSGSGNRQKQKREIASFTSISTNGAFHIEVVAQKALTFEIEADDNILPLITTEVSNNVLHIKPGQSYSVSEPIIIRIGVPDLEAITSNGAGKIDVAGLNNEKFEIDLNGATAIRVSGETKLVDIDTNGAGKIDTSKLRAARAVVASKGVSRVEVHAADQLDVTVSGPSSVVYSGDPVVNKTVNGPGSVQKKASSVS